MTDLVDVARGAGGRPSICQSGLQDALVPGSAGANRAGGWFVVANGRRLRALRRQRGLSRVMLAGRAGISLTTVSKLERQDRASCRGRTLARLGAALGVQPAALMPEPIRGDGD